MCCLIDCNEKMRKWSLIRHDLNTLFKERRIYLRSTQRGKVVDFSATQILREINFGRREWSKTAIFKF